jgi:hypothetical protein
MSLKLTFKIIAKNELAGDFDYKPYNVRATMTDYRNFVDTLTGMRSTMIDEVEVWCKENNCGVRYDEYVNLSLYTFKPSFGFDTEEQLALFMLRWA